MSPWRGDEHVPPEKERGRGRGMRCVGACNPAVYRDRRKHRGVERGQGCQARNGGGGGAPRWCRSSAYPRDRLTMMQWVGGCLCEGSERSTCAHARSTSPPPSCEARPSAPVRPQPCVSAALDPTPYHHTLILSSSLRRRTGAASLHRAALSPPPRDACGTTRKDAPTRFDNPTHKPDLRGLQSDL